MPFYYRAQFSELFLFVFCIPSTIIFLTRFDDSSFHNMLISFSFTVIVALNYGP